MSKRKGPETTVEVLRALSDFLSGPEPDFSKLSHGEVQRYLKKNAIDTSGLLEAVSSELARARGRLELAEARGNRGSVLEKLSGLTRERVSGAREELLSQIATLTGPKQAAVYFRKYEKASIQDLQGILEDLQRLEHLRTNTEDDEE